MNTFTTNETTSLAPVRRRGRRLWLFFTVALTLLSAPGIASARTAPMLDDDRLVNVIDRMSYLEDPRKEYAIGDVSSPSARWKPVPSKNVNFGYTRSAYWFRLSLDNPGSAGRETLLEIDFPTLDHVSLYKPAPGGGYAVSETGDRLPFVHREILDANFLFRLDLPAGTSTCYLRVETAGSLRFGAALLPAKTHLERKNRHLPLLWLLYGMMLLTALFTLSVFVLIRDRVYLYFALFSLLILLFQSAHRGFAFQFLWPQSAWWANVCSPVFLNLMGSFSALFLRHTMNTKNTSRPIDRLLSLSGFGLFPAAAAVSPALPVSVSLPATYYLLLGYALFVIILTLYYLMKKNRFARYFLGGMSLTGVFTIIGALTALGKLPSNAFTEWSTEAGFLGLILFASLGLVDRIMELNTALLLSRKDIARKNETLNLKNQELEATNEELQATMEELEASNEEFEAQNEELMSSQREIEEKTRELDNYFNYALDLFCIADTDGYFHRLNSEWEKVLGYSLVELQGARFLDFVHPDDVETTLGVMTKLNTQNEVLNFTNRYRRRDGAYRWIEWRSYPHGKLIYAAARDITERIVAMEETKKSEERFRTLIESSPEPILLARDNRLFYGNSAFCRLIGANDQSEFTGRSLLDFVAPEKRAEVAFFAAARLRGEPVPAHYEAVGLRLDGSTLPYEISVASVELPDGPASLAYVRDISERRESEKALRESEEKYRTLVENISEIVYTADEEGKFTYVSPAIERVSDYRAADLIGADTFSLIHPDDLARVMDDSRALREGVIKPTEYRVRQKNGEYRWIMSTSRPIMKDGRFTGSSGVLTDIHERRLAEEALRESENRYRTLSKYNTRLNDIFIHLTEAENFNDLFDRIAGSFRDLTGAVSSSASRYDPANGQIEVLSVKADTAVMERVEAIVGATVMTMRLPVPSDTAAEMIAATIRRFTSLEEFSFGLVPREISDTVMRALESESIVAIALHYGARLLGSAAAFLPREHDGIPDYALKTFAQMAGLALTRRESEETLRETVDTLHRSQQIALISNWRYDIAARLFIASGEGLQSWGFHDNPHPSIEEVSRRIHPEDRAMVSRAFERAVYEGVPYSVEFRIRAKNSRETRYILSLGEVHRDENGSPDYLFGINQDITDLKQAEIERERMQAQLLQAQKMEAVGTLAGGIAHDFNNMLGGIMGSLNLVEMLLDKDTPPRKETLLKYVETAMDSSRRAADMIKQLLTLSRKSGMQTAPVDVNLSLKHVLKLCQNSFPKSVGLDFHIGDAPLRIQADPVQIEQVFLNLCVNASHAMTVMRPEGDRQGGYLSVDTGEVLCDSRLDTTHPNARAGETYVRVRVSDTGVGMDEETRRHIFDPFYTTKKREDGTGLGLAMAYSIVKQHDGFIDVYSEPGKGSTFTVYLPALKDAAPADAPKKARNPIVPGAGTVLVIDDEKAILRIARGMLEQCGYRVLTAESGEEGLGLFRKDPGKVDGVLLDLSMPEMSGMEVFNSLKETDPGVKVILASGLMEDDEVKKALALGVKGFLQKPYSAEELSVKMKEALE